MGKRQPFRVGLLMAFERREERFAEGIIVAVPNRAHRWAHACVLAALAEGNRGVLRALIGMMNRLFRIPLLGGHVECVEDQLGAHAGGHSPADNAPAEGVQHD